jgi:hypothetical protein
MTSLAITTVRAAKIRDKYDELENAAKDGVFATPIQRNLRMRDLLEYCKKTGKNLKTLTDEEIAKFEE